MGRLFWKIFLWFWLTLILVMVVSNWVTAKYLQLNNEGLNNSFVQRVGQSRIDSLANVIKFSGEDAARNILKNSKQGRRFRGTIFVYDENGKEILGRNLSKKTRSERHPDIPKLTLKQKISDPQGKTYSIEGQFFKLQRNKPIFPLFERQFKRTPWLILLWIGVALALSSAICFWLAWYLTRPIRHLQKASRQLASGDLDVRVAALMGNRRDEIADLGKDFDHMAGRLQDLLMSQKQLLSDISHELRSPLARLQIALGLTRKKTDEHTQKELDRIEREVNRLDDLIGQALTLSRIETSSNDINIGKDKDYVDLALFLEEIIKDAKFEAKAQSRSINLKISHTGIIAADSELLHRALENVIRNAIFYTKENTQVEVTLDQSNSNSDLCEIIICDHGPGVPEDRLANLFEPFVRISNSRTRDSGGYGLGLAIAKRSIHLHGGTITARNRKRAGLCITILLPVASD